MARRRDKRNIPSVSVKAVKDKAESYEGDDEGRDESPPASPVTAKAKLDNDAPAPQLDSSEAESAEPAKESPKKGKKTPSKLNNGVAAEESESTPESSKKNKKGVKLDNGVATAETEPAAVPSKKSKKGKSKKEKKEEFEVEQIVGMEVNNRWSCPVRFRVRWVGYTEKDDTWVSVNNLNCENFVEDFLSISGRTSEYEKAMERAQRPSQWNPEYRESLRKRGRPEYCEDSDEGEEMLLTTSTRTRKTRRPDMFNPSDSRPQLLKLDRKKVPKVGVSRAHALAEQAGREYEVVLITDHRVKGRFTEYKVRWKGLASSHDSWVPESSLTCPKLIAEYLESVKSEPEEEYELAAIIDSREVDGDVSYLVRWKGFSAKFDSWLPEDEMNCPDMIKKFEDSLEKLNKKENTVKKKKTTTQNDDSDQSDEEKTAPQKKKKTTRRNVDSDQSDEEKSSPPKKKKTNRRNVDSDQSDEEKPTSQKKKKTTSKNVDSDQSDEEKTSSQKKKTTSQNVESDQSNEEKVKDSDEEEITVKKSKNKRKRSSSRPSTKPSPAAQSKDTRKRRITLPVSYDEDELSE